MAKLEGTFGLEGYARWWKVLEIIARQMDETDRCFVEYPKDKWKQLLSIKQEKFLNLFLNFCQTFGKLLLNHSQNFIKVECPKLLELRDEHTKKLRSKSGVNQEQDLELDYYLKKERAKVDRPVGERFAFAALPQEFKNFCLQERPELDPETVFKKFTLHWQSKTSTDWFATWQKWVLDEHKKIIPLQQQEPEAIIVVGPEEIASRRAFIAKVGYQTNV